MVAGALITELWQVEWRGVVWGGETPVIAVTDLGGWLDRPPLRGSNAERPGRHGSHPGRKVAETRTVEVELTVMSDDPDSALLRGIENATAYTEEPEEEDLVIWAGTEQPHLVRARLERVAIPTDHDWSIGHHRSRLQWVATDPRRYLWFEETSPILGMPGGSITGITFPLTLPVTFGSGISSGSITVTNSGNAATWPTFTLTGPLTGPTIINANTGQQLRFAPSYVLEDGQTMVIDTDARSVTIDAGVSRRDALISADWFPLPAGVPTTITLASTGTYDAGAGLQVAWRSAYL